MKKKKYSDKKVFNVEVDVFNSSLIVTVNTTKEEAMKDLKKQYSGETKDWFKSVEECLSDSYERMFSGNARGVFHHLIRGYMINLRLPKNEFRNSVGYIVHEVTHLAHSILRDRRIPLNEDTEEVYTYLIQYLTVAILNKLY